MFRTLHSHKPLYCFRTTCVSVKPAKLLVLPVIWLPSWISSTRRRPRKFEVPLLESLTLKTGVAVGILMNDMFHSFEDITTSG